MVRRVAVLVVSVLFVVSAFAQTKPDPCVATNVCQELKPVGEIASSGGTLQGIIDLKAENRTITDFDTGQKDAKKAYPVSKHVLRAYQGYQGFDLTKGLLPSGAAYPGPTLRARVGENVQLVFLNRIDPAMFAATSVTSKKDQCDQSSTEKGPLYPGPNEKFPNCFHASNTSNLHFHGTHVSPGGFGDNVLIGVLPNKSLDVKAAIEACRKVFVAPRGNAGEFASLANTMLTKMRDDAQARGDTELTLQLQTALDANTHNAAAGEWPQYWPGFYPYTFTLPVASGTNDFPVMGQSPGTHWYHAHQHGSTTTHSLNGLSGVFVITGDYDDKLLALGGGTPQHPKIAEKVMVFQLFEEQPNLVLQSNGGAIKTITAVNGQVVPTVTMKKGEVQWWRIANAAVKANGMDQYLFISSDVYQSLALDPTKLVKGVYPPSKNGSVPRLHQTAQDGVQLDWKNYQALPPLTVTDDTELTTFPMAPGNRVDMLVQAPATEGVSYLIFWPAVNTNGAFSNINRNLVLRVVVKGDAAGVNTSLPDAPAETAAGKYPYPTLPDFLDDIDASTVRVRRTVTFSMTKGPNTTNPDPNDSRVDPPNFMIDGKQFSEGSVDQVMLLGNAEEWTLVNTSPTGVSHPFHIHVNPFQVTEVYDPSQPKSAFNGNPLPGPLLWWDTISIPASVTDATTGVVTNGYVKMRSRFVDFPGKFVLHCHILGHEDRGMMQLVWVVDNHTVVRHH